MKTFDIVLYGDNVIVVLILDGKRTYYVGSHKFNLLSAAKGFIDQRERKRFREGKYFVRLLEALK